MDAQQSGRFFQPSSRATRRGLAPLEFVLWLPVLLLVMALMVNIGTMAAWRVRGEIVARDAVWRTRFPRTGHDEPRPPQHVWPPPAQVEVEPDANVAALDDDALRHSVVRGPLGAIEVNELLAPEVGTRRGTAEIARAFPLLAKLGTYRSGQISHALLDRLWQLTEMGLPSNLSRRTKAIYEFPKVGGRLSSAYLNAVRAVIAMPNFGDLNVLDGDEELARYSGSEVDFHPRVGHMCEIDPRVVRVQEVARLIGSDGHGGEIARLPRTLTESVLAAFRAANSAHLQVKIQQLEVYLARLSQLDGQ